jgi:hypothetical protein
MTSSMGFVDAPSARVSDQLMTWMAETKGALGIDATTRIIRGSLDEVLHTLLPLRIGEPNRFLLLPTRSSQTCYLDNGYRGTDSAAIAYLAKALGCRTAWIVAVPNTLRRVGKQWQGRQGTLVLEVYGPHQTEWVNTVRAIRLVNDAGSWEFDAVGDPYPFEEGNRYLDKKVSDRFTLDMLKRYSAELGLHPFDADFYLPPTEQTANLVQLSGNLPKTSKDVSLGEARRLNRIED